MSGYLATWIEWEQQSQAARDACPLCDESIYCPAPDDGHLVGCRHNRLRLGLVGDRLFEIWFGVEVRS